RVIYDSLVAAFHGAPKTIEAIQVGGIQAGPGNDASMNLVQAPIRQKQPQRSIAPIPMAASMPYDLDGQREDLAGVADEVEQAMADLIDRELVTVRRHGNWVEVEIKTDILFPSGVATLSPPAEQVLEPLADEPK